MSVLYLTHKIDARLIWDIYSTSLENFQFIACSNKDLEGGVLFCALKVVLPTLVNVYVDLLVFTRIAGTS